MSTLVRKKVLSVDEIVTFAPVGEVEPTLTVHVSPVTHLEHVKLICTSVNIMECSGKRLILHPSVVKPQNLNTQSTNTMAACTAGSRLIRLMSVIFCCDS
jgi:hypothetical protein